MALVHSSTTSFRTAQSNFDVTPTHTLQLSTKSRNTTDSAYLSSGIYQYYHNYNTKSFLTDSSGSKPNMDTLDPPLHPHRSISNPFDVLYDPEKAHNNSFYFNSEPPRVAPSVTVIESGVRRTGSVVSSSASLRNRNRIKKRNRTAYNHSVDSDVLGNASTLKKTTFRDKLRFVFPVNRKKSLKYTSLAKQKPDFTTNDQLRQFLTSVNAEALARELLPNQMAFYKYNNILPPAPTLHSSRRPYQVINGENGGYSFHPLPKRIPSEIEHLGLANRHLPKHSTPLHPSNLISSPHKRAVSSVPIQDIIYHNYKNAVFRGKHKTPPRFQELFPNDVHLLTTKEINHINRKLLFEVLLRRTLAAKIEYRLKQFKTKSRSSSSSDSKGPSDEDRPSKFQLDPSQSKDLKPNKNKGSENSAKLGKPQTFDNVNHSITQHYSSLRRKPPPPTTTPSVESITTEKLIQQNASLVSAMLPSPQISYASDIFGSIYNKSNSVDSHDLSSRTQKKSYPSRNPSSSKNRSTLVPAHSTESLYINDFNKAYYSKYKPKETSGYEQTLFDSILYQLKPMQRSAATLSTSDKSERKQFGSLSSGSIQESMLPQEISFGADGSRKHHSYSSSSKSKRYSLPSQGSKRKSQSTTNTSIFQNLDELSSDLSSYIEGDPKEKTTFVPHHFKRYSLSSLDQKETLHDQTSQNILDSLWKVKQSSPIQIINHIPKINKPEKNSPETDIRSLKGTTSMAGSVTETGSNSSAGKMKKDIMRYHTINE